MDRLSKLHRQIEHFFSKIDSSGQLEPLISYSIKKQHQVIPGPARFHRRTAKNVRRARLLELYDADSYFSSQLVGRLQPQTAITVHGNAFLKMMEILVTIFNIYLHSKDSMSSKCAATKMSYAKCTVEPKSPITKMSDKKMSKKISKKKMLDTSTVTSEVAQSSNNVNNWTSKGGHSTNNSACKPSQSRKQAVEFTGGRKQTDLDKGYDIVNYSFTKLKRKTPSSKGDNLQSQYSSHKKLKVDGHNSSSSSSTCARTLVWNTVK